MARKLIQASSNSDIDFKLRRIIRNKSKAEFKVRLRLRSASISESKFKLSAS